MKKMSRGEVIIKDWLDECNIKYIYEYPLLIMEERCGEIKQRIWYPDFWLSEFGIVIEYFGLKGKKSYDEGVKHKKENYKQLNIDLIPIYPETLKKDYKSYILKQIQMIINSKNRIFKENLKKK